MIYRYILLFTLLHNQFLTAQVIPSERRTDWSLAGYQITVPVYDNVVDITSFGGSGDGVTANDTAIGNALDFFNGACGTIYFPSGNFLFRSSINLPDSIVLKGSTSESTTLSFDLGGSGDLIRVHGGVSSNIIYVAEDAHKDSTSITVSDSAFLQAGDYIKVFQNDSALVASSWAYKSVGQIVQVKGADGYKVELNSPLRRSYLVVNNVRIQKINPRTNTGIECLKIKRLDATAGQSNNIDFNYAVKCWVKGVESDSCNFAHIAISNSTNIEVTGCYLHNAFAYGGGGQAYGALIQYTSGECLIENNIFDRLRHSMLLQAGANGNVFAYNSSTNPYWISGGLPANSAGDMVLHGNYVFMNLFEGNTGQNIVIDDSHGKNGPYNTFFRNRADLYGIFMSNNPASDSQNFVGNEITNNGFLMGMYQLSGTGHFAYGNNVKGTATPANTSSLSDTSCYLKSKPGFWTAGRFPSIGYPNTISSGGIPAQERKQASTNLTDCRIEYPVIIDVGSIKTDKEVKIYPNPSNGLMQLYYIGGRKLQVTVTDVTGKIITVQSLYTNTEVDITSVDSGIYFLIVSDNGDYIGTEKIVIAR